MRLNNKGFAISSIMYIILVLAVILISLILVTLSSRKLILDKLKDEVLTTIYDAPSITYRQTIKALKNEAIAYMTDNSLQKESIKIDTLNSSIDSEVLSKYNLNDKYLTSVQNTDSYNVYLGKEETISKTTELPKNTIDIVDYKIYGNSVQEGENLFDVNNPNIITGYITNTDVLSAASTTKSVVIECLPNTEYKVSKILSQRFAIGFSSVFPEQGVVISNKVAGNSSTSLTGTSAEDSKYLVIWLYHASYDTMSIDDIISTLEVTYSKPTPQTPIGIESVGDRTKNLIKSPNQLTLSDPSNTSFANTTLRKWTPDTYVKGITYANEYRKSSCSLTIEDGKYNMSWTSNVSSSYGIGFPLVNLTVGKQYSISFKKDGSGYAFAAFYDKDGNFISYENRAHVFTVPENTVYTVICINGNASTTHLTVWDVQVEEGATATEYEPYGYKIPVISKGKNLFDISTTDKYKTYVTGLIIEDNKLKGQVLDSTASSHAYSLTNYSSGQYSISFTNNDNKYVRMLIRCFDENGVLLNNSNVLISKFTYNAYYNGWFFDGEKVSVTIPSNVSYWQLGFAFIGDSSMIGQYRTISNIQVEKGLNFTEYEPYVESTTTNIYLNEPLRKVNKYYDYTDFKNSKVFRNIKEMAFTGEEDWRKNIYGTNAYFLVVDKPLTTQNMKLVYSNSFKGVAYTDRTVSENNIVFIDDVYKSINVRNTEYADLTNFTNFLKNNSVKANYVLSEYDPQTINLPRINTNLGATQISIDTNIKPSNYEFTVIKKIIEI